MKTLSGKDWAYFIKRLGLPYVQALVIRFADDAEDDRDVWDRFIASNPIYLAAAEANKITEPDDIARFLRDASYASMRATFPSRSHGRGIIGPRLVPLRKLQEDGIVPNLTVKKKEPIKDSTPQPAPKKKVRILRVMVGKKVYHQGKDGTSFGKGIITKVDGDLFTVLFDSVGEKRFSYTACSKSEFLKNVD